MYNFFHWLLIAPVVLPLVFVDGLLFPHVTLKTLLFRGLFVLAFACFVYLVFSGREFYWGRLKNKVVWIPAGLVAVAFLTSALGVDFYHSFWSTFERGDGLLTLLSAVGFFYLVVLYADKKFLSVLYKTVAWVGTLTAVFALVQWLEVSLGINFPIVDEPRGRIGGTFGNAAFLAGYLGMTFFATLATATELKGKWQSAAYGGALLQAIVIFLTATRGAMLAFIIIGAVALIYASFRATHPKLRFWARIFVVAVAILGGTFFTFRSEIAKIPFEPISRLALVSVSESTISSRLFIWKSFLPKVAEKPILGYGAEHIAPLFNEVYDPTQIKEQWFDRSHNSFFDYLLQYGIFGLFFYCGVILLLGFLGWKMWKKGDVNGIFFLAMAMFYSIHNFFVFDTAMTLWLLFVFTGSVFIFSEEKEIKKGSVFRPRAVLASIAGLLVLSLVLPIFVTPLRANIALASGYNKHVSDVGKAVEYFEKGLSLNTYADLEYGYQAYSMYTDRQVTMLSGDERVLAFEYAVKILSQNLEKYPYDGRTAMYLAHVLDLTPMEAERDTKFLEEIIEKTINISPKRSQPWFLKANIFIRQGADVSSAEKMEAYGQAIDILREYITRVPKDPEPYFVIANLYRAMGESERAAEESGKGLEYYTSDAKVAGQALPYYIGVRDWETAKFFMEDVVEGDSHDYTAVYELAKLNFLTGDLEESLRLAEIVRKEAPEVFDSDPAFVEAVQEMKGE
ncbi:MAG: O-antigen ligase family protein [bacterium]|nr:O-antigen ligase family protein [bacterium]